MVNPSATADPPPYTVAPKFVWWDQLVLSAAGRVHSEIRVFGGSDSHIVSESADTHTFWGELNWSAADPDVPPTSVCGCQTPAEQALPQQSRWRLEQTAHTPPPAPQVSFPAVLQVVPSQHPATQVVASHTGGALPAQAPFTHVPVPQHS
jgi:hypothetical protein